MPWLRHRSKKKIYKKILLYYFLFYIFDLSRSKGLSVSRRFTFCEFEALLDKLGCWKPFRSRKPEPITEENSGRIRQIVEAKNEKYFGVVVAGSVQAPWWTKDSNST